MNIYSCVTEVQQAAGRPSGPLDKHTVRAWRGGFGLRQQQLQIVVRNLICGRGA